MSPHTELSNALGIISARKPICIQRFPTGKYGLVGSVPLLLYDQEARRTCLWQTEQEVIDALLALKITRFQLDDCSWYEGKRP